MMGKTWVVSWTGSRGYLNLFWRECESFTQIVHYEHPSQLTDRLVLAMLLCSWTSHSAIISNRKADPSYNNQIHNKLALLYYSLWFVVFLCPLQEKQRMTDKLEDTSLRLKDEMDLYRKIMDKLWHNRHEFQKEKEAMQEVRYYR